MTRKHRSITISPELIESLTERSKMTFDLQVKLVDWLADRDEIHRKFQFAVITKIARIEALITQILVSELAQAQRRDNFVVGEKLESDVKAADEFAIKQGLEIGQKMVRHNYSKRPAPEPRRDKRRKWHGREI